MRIREEKLRDWLAFPFAALAIVLIALAGLIGGPVTRHRLVHLMDGFPDY
jgi:hypothetical protein